MSQFHPSFVALACLVIIGDAEAEATTKKTYSCTIFEKAGIESTHLEGAPPPRSYSEHEVQTTFGLIIEPIDSKNSRYVASETYYRGRNPDRTDYDSEFTLLHSRYYGDGKNFTANEDQAFLRFSVRADGSASFYHAGFEYPGGEDVRLSVRFGECLVDR